MICTILLKGGYLDDISNDNCNLDDDNIDYIIDSDIE